MPITVKEVPSGNETLRKDKDMLVKQAKVDSLKSGYPTRSMRGMTPVSSHSKDQPKTRGR